MSPRPCDIFNWIVTHSSILHYQQHDNNPTCNASRQCWKHCSRTAEQDDGFLMWVISVHTLTLKLTSITFFDFKFWFLLFVFSFLASRNRISLSPRRAERCSAVHWRTGQSNVMFVKTAGCCRWCKILWISSGLKGLEQSDSAMVWKTQQPNRRRCDNEQCYHTVTHNLNACWWWRYSDTRWLLL